MIPEEFLARHAIFQRIASVDDFWFPCRFPGTFVSFSGFPEKFLFYMGMINSIELPRVGPPRRIDDCFETHFVH